VTDQPSGRADVPADRPHVLAFYLPQFHLVPENDAWHGAGFTEWTVVARSKPLYPGHRQPDLPGELGFYDLRVPETRYLQARLAREHGITGFLYYHYWFNGKRMLGRPFDEVLTSGRPDFPFALCWANESWYRRWQGSVDEMLVEQEFSEEDDLEHIRWLIGCFKDPRYIRIGGRPLLTVYRAQHLPDPQRTVALWRKECQAAGVESPWLVMFETGDDTSTPSQLGFDAGAEFVPHRLPYLIDNALSTNLDGSHTVYEYDDVAAAYLDRPATDWQRYPCVATGWDNTPRRQAGDAFILRNATPDGYARWLNEAVSRQSQSEGGDGIVFVNAWNEWAEGAHLEPGVQWGRAYLEATRDVLRRLFGDEALEPALVEPDDAAAASAEDLYHDLYQQFVALQKSASGFLSYADRRLTEWKKAYEALLEESRAEARTIADLNEKMAAQLAFLAQRLREMGEEVPPMPWLVRP
jgi:O-antigen biosynthesis protein